MGLIPGSELRVYDTPTGGAPISSDNTAPYHLSVPNVTTTTTYYLESINTVVGCFSPVRLPVVVTIYQLPGQPTVPNFTRCGPGPVTLTVAIGFGGAVALLYDLPANGSVITSDDAAPFLLTLPNVLTSVNFWAASKDPNTGCESVRTPVAITILPNPDAPISFNVSRCGSGSVVFTAIMGQIAGDMARLYTTATGGAPIASDNVAPYELATPQLNTTTNFYIEAVTSSNNCVSARTPVQAVVLPKVDPPLATHQSICGPGAATFTVQNTSPIGNEMRLYTQASGGGIIAQSTSQPFILQTPVISTTTTFYVAAANNITACESGRIPITVTVNDIPGIPQAVDVTRCGEGSVTFTATLSTPPANMARLYDQPIGGLLISTDINAPFLLSSGNLTTTATFYIEAYNTVTGCASVRAPVKALITPGPALPLVSDIYRCGAGVGTFVAGMNIPSGTEILMYTSASSTTPYMIDNSAPFEFPTMPHTTTATYYFSVRNTILNCESGKVAASIIIQDLPGPPVANNFAICGPGDATITAFMGNPAGETIRLYAQATGGLPIASDSFAPYELSVNVLTSTTYYLESVFTASGCGSLRAPVVIKVEEVPGAPLAENTTRCEPGVITFTANMGAPAGNMLRLYTVSSGGFAVATTTLAPFNISATVSTTTTFYLESANASTSCPSPRVAVVATVLPKPGAPQAINVTRCGPGPVTITTLMGVPQGNIIELYTTAFGSDPIATDDTAPYMLVTPPVNVSTVFYLKSKMAGAGCISNPTAINISVEQKPGPPVVSDVTRCGPGIVTFQPLPGLPISTEMRLYDAPSNGMQIAVDNIVPFELATPLVQTTTTYWVESYSSINGCSSDRVPVSATIAPVPSRPIVNDVSRCGNGPVTITAQMGDEPGTSIRLFNAAFGGSQLAFDDTPIYELTTPSITTNSVFFVESYSSLTGCSSERVSVLATKLPTPLAPSIPNASRCGGGTVVFESSPLGPDEYLKLYDQPTGGAVISTTIAAPYQLPTQEISFTTTYYVEKVFVSTGCPSPRTPVVAIVHPLPASPDAPNVARCGSGKATFTVLFAQQGVEFRLYDSSSGGSIIATDATLPYELTTSWVTTHTTFYVSMIDPVTGCESERKPVVVTIQLMPDALPQQIAYHCGEGRVTFNLGSNIPFGSVFSLYNTSVGGELIVSATNAPYTLTTPFINTTTTFYIEPQFNNCKGPRIEAIAVIQPRPQRPLAPPVSRCGRGIVTFSAAAPINSELRIYSVPVGGVALTTVIHSPYYIETPTLAGSATFYLEATDPQTGCSSLRTPVVATVNELPQAPSVANIVRCGSSVLTFTATLLGANEFRLYDAEVGGNLLYTDNSAPYQVVTPLTTTHSTYFVSSANTLTGCESSRLPVIVTIHPVPGLPQVAPVSRCGGGSVTFMANLALSGGNGWAIYTEMIGGILVGQSFTAPDFNITTPVINTTTTFYAAATDNITGCSGERIPIEATVIPLPPVPNSQDVSQCGSQPANLTVALEPGYRINLYKDIANGQLVASTQEHPYIVTTPMVEATTTFYIATQALNTGCESQRIPVVVKVYPRPSNPEAAEVSRCGGGSVTFLPVMGNIPGTHLLLYGSLGDATPIVSDGSPSYELTTPPISTTTVFYIESYDQVSGCRSARVPVKATVKALPLPPTPSVLPLCGSGVTTITATMANSLGMQARLFDSPTAVFPLFSDLTIPFELPTPPISTSTTFYVESYDVESNCSSVRIPVVIEPQTPPAPPVVSSSITRCGPGDVTFSAQMGNPVGNEIRVYENNQLLFSDNTSPFEFLIPNVGQSRTYSISAVNTTNGCESSRRPFSVTVLDVPAPIASQEVIRCGAGSVVFSAELGNMYRLRLYANSVGGDPIAIDNVAPFSVSAPLVITNTTFYLEVEHSQTGCRSPRSVASVIIQPEPSAPIVSNINICGSQAAQLTVSLMNSTSSSMVRLFQTANTSDVLASVLEAPYVLTTPINVTTTTYFVDHFDHQGQCASARVPVVVTVVPVPADPVIANVQRCGPGSLSFSVNMPAGYKAELFESLVGGSPLDAVVAPPYVLTTPVISNTTNFFVQVTSTATLCKSSRVQAIALVKEKPSAPTASDVQRCGPGSVSFVANLVSGDRVYLYNEISGGTPIATAAVFPYTLFTPVLQTTTTFFLSSALQSAGCESERIPVVVFINSQPTAPIVANAARCGAGPITLTNITVLAPSTELRIYSMPQTQITTAVSTIAPYHISFNNVVTTTTYYASAYNPVTGCESERTSFVLQIYPELEAPLVNSVSRCGEGSVQFTINTPSLPNESLQLFDTPQGGAPLAIANVSPFVLTSPSITQTREFYVSRINTATGCSSARARARAIINMPPAIAVAENLRRCGAGAVTYTAQMTSPAGSQIRLYTTPIGGAIFSAAEGPAYLLVSPVVTTNSTFYLEAYDEVTQCVSARNPVSLDILDTPQPPIVQNVARCGNGAVTFTAISFANVVRVYTVPTGGSSLLEAAGSPTELTIPGVSFTTTYYFEAVSQICPSNARTMAVALIQPLPGRPVTANVSVCGSSSAAITASMGNPVGDEMRLYDAQQGGNLVSFASNAPFILSIPVVSTTTTFFLESAVPAFGCASDRIPVVITVNPIPSAPLIKSAYRCGPGVVKFMPLVALGNTVRMYSSLSLQAALLAEADTEPYELFTPFITTNTQFYFSIVNHSTGCESDRVSAQAVINSIPNTPVTQDIYRCGSGDIALSATPLEGDVFVYYYDSPTSNTPVAIAQQPPYSVSTGVTTTTTFYVSAYHPFSGCESPRKALVVMVEPIPARPVAPQISRCGPGKATLSVLLNQPAGDAIRLYADEFTDLVLATAAAPTTQLTTPEVLTTTTYYIASVHSSTGCASPRTPVIVEINPVPGAPRAPRVERCGPGIATFTATFTSPFGDVVRVYTTPSATEPIYADDIAPFEIPTQFITTTTTYYITSLYPLTGCESEKVPVVIKVNELPSLPIAQNQSRCGAGVVTLSAILPSNHELYIYDQLLANYPIAIVESAPYTYQTQRLDFNTTYYLQSVNSITGCSSGVLPVQVHLRPVPEAPVYADASVCGRSEVTLLPLSVTSGMYIRLFDLLSNEIQASNNAPYHLSIGEVATNSTYYVQAIDPVTGCVSERSAVRVRLLERPASPVAENVQRCGAGDIVFTVNAPSGTEVRLYSAPPQNALLYTLQSSRGEIPVLGVASTTVYYLEAIDRATGCSSSLNSVTALIRPLPQITSISQSEQTCLGGVLHLTAAGPAEAHYVWRGPGNFYATGATVTRLLENRSYAGSYTVYAVVDGCTSEVASTEVVLNRGIEPVLSYFSGLSQNGPVCEGQDLRITIDNRMQFPSGTTFIWQGPEMILFTQESELVIPNAQTINEGFYYVSAIINGCTSQVSNEVKILISKYPQTPVVLNTGPYCEDAPGGIRITAVTQEADIRYSWVGPSGFTSSAPSLNLPATLANAGTYQLVVTNAAGCTSQAGLTEVAVIPTPPTPTAINSGPICEGQPLTLQAQGVTAQTYIWTGPNGFNLATNSDNYRISSATLRERGDYTLSVVVNGCTSAQAFTSVRINERPQKPTVFTNAPICEGQTLSLTASGSANATYIWSGPNNFNLTSGNVSIPQATTLHGGNYSVIAVSNGCESEAAGIFVTVNPAPPRPIVNNSLQACTGTALSLTASGAPGAIYQWRGPNNFNAVGSTVNRLISSLLDAGNYSVVAIASGCTSAPAIVNVGVTQTPLRPTIIADEVNCTGDILKLTAAGSGGVQYRWSGPDNWEASGVSVSRTISSTLQNGVYSLIAINGNCTSALATRSISVSQTPPMPVVNNMARVCEGGMVTLTASIIGTATFEWTGPSGILQTSESPNLTLQDVTLANAGVYSVVTKQNGCVSGVSTITLSVEPMPATPLARANSPVCIGNTLVLSASGSGNASYFWSGPMNFNAAGSLVNRVTTSTQETGTYQVYAVANGCTSSVASVEATVLPLPLQPIISSNSPLCAGQTLTLTAETTPGAQIVWSGPNGFSASGASVTRLLNSTLDQGVYSAIAIFGGCSSTVGVTQVLVSAAQSLSIRSSGSACAGQTLTLTADFIEGAKYSWSGPAGFASTQRVVTLQNLETIHSGLYSVVATIGNCSTQISNISVTVTDPPPTPGIASNAPICVGDELRLTAIGTGGVEYVWSGPNGFSSSLQNPVIPNATILETGSYSVFAVAKGCSSRVVATSVVVNNIPQAPIVSSNSPVCTGSRLSLNASTIPGARYHWSGPNNFSATSQNPLLPSASAQMGGAYSVVAIVNGCTSLPSVTSVTVTPTPATPQAKNNSPICQGQTLELSASGSVTGYFWSGPNGFTSTAQNPQVLNAEVLSSGVYQVVAVVDNCTSQIMTTEVTVLPIPKGLIASSNEPLCQGEALNLTATGITGATYQWSGPLGFSSTQQNPMINPAQAMHSGVYSVVANLNGCSSPVATVSVNISTPPTLSLIQKVDAGCRRGSIMVSATGGVGGYLYSLDGVNYTNTTGAFTNLSPGNYVVYVKSGGCVSSLTIQINDATQTQITSISLSPNNGNTVNLQWTPVDGAVRYNVRYRIAGSGGTWQEVSNLTGTTASIADLFSNRTYEFEVQAVCNSVHKGPWSSTQSITTTSGTGASACETPANVSGFATSGFSAVVSWTPVPQAVCYVVGVGLLAQHPDLWNYQLVPAPNSSVSVSNLQPATEYGVMVRANCTTCSMRNGSLSDWSNQSFFMTSSAKQHVGGFNINGLSIYPNPSKGVFEVSFEATLANELNIAVRDVLGRVVLERRLASEVGANKFTLDISSEATGVYLLEIKTSGSSEVVKLIKQD
jgi:hypothetical protein